MTDLGNGLLAISVPGKAEKFHFVNSDTKYICFFGADTDNIRLNVSTIDKYEILGTVTASEIGFDVEPHVPSDHGMLNNQYYFRCLLSSKGLHFENPLEYMKESCKGNWQGYEEMHECWQQAQNNLIEKLVIIKRL